VTVWDPAGQERYAPLTKTFFRKAHGAAIVFAADDPSSWQGVEFWLKELDEYAPDDIEIILICNKIDIIEEDDEKGEDIDKSTTQKQQMKEWIREQSSELLKKALEVARLRRVPFYMTSAKSGECVKQAFQELVSQILANEMLLQKLQLERDGSTVTRKTTSELPKSKIKLYDQQTKQEQEPEIPNKKKPFP